MIFNYIIFEMTSLYVNPWINPEFFFPSQGVLYPYPEGIKVYIKPFPDWFKRLILVMARVWVLAP